MHRTPRLAHAPVAVARRHERDLGGALSLAQLQGHPPLSRRYLKPTPLDKLDQWSLSHVAGYLSWWEVVILRRLLSKGVALVAARADDGEIHYSGARSCGGCHPRAASLFSRRLAIAKTLATHAARGESIVTD